jgi:hypothetical protein
MSVKAGAIPGICLGSASLALIVSHAFAATPQERSLAVQGCTQAILDDAWRAYARRAGQDPNSAQMRQALISRLKAEKPEALNAIAAQCTCTIDFILRNGGTLQADDAVATMKKHQQRVAKECPTARF